MRSLPLPLATAALLLLGACGGELPAPRPTGMSPERGYVGDDTVVTITGRDFYPQVEVDATGGSRADVNAGFTAELVGADGRSVRLDGVSLTDYRHLQGIVGSGLSPGAYDLVVTGPTGVRGTLVDAWTATSTRADRLRVDSDQLVYEVHDTAVVEVELVDPTGQRVLSDLSVVVVVTSDAGAVDTTFAAASLEDQEPFSNGFGIQGRLGADGFARISLSVSTPLLVDVTVAAADLGSGVAEGVLKLLYEPGSERVLDLALPAMPFTARVGEAFPLAMTLLDQFGNPVTGVSETVLLKNACDSWVDVVTFTGSTTVDVVLQEVTGTPSCGADRIVTLSGPSGQSAEFSVVAGPVARLDVQATPGSVVAGTASLNAFVRPVDAFGNLASWRPSALLVTDTVGGVAASDCVGAVSVLCEVTPTVAGTGIQLIVEDADGVVGRSNPYTVVPAGPASLGVEVLADPAVAGTPVGVAVRVRDAFGNAVPGASFSAAQLQVTTADGPVACADATSTDPAVAMLACTFTRAGDTTASVVLSPLGLEAGSGTFRVVNGPLDAVTVAPDTASVVAGDALGVTLTAEDAWGNPYLVQADPVLALADDAGSVSPNTVTLSADGSVRVSVTFTVAGPTTLVASQGGTERGAAALVVHPGPAIRLEPEAAVGWVWTGAPVAVRVEALDAFDNRAALTTTASVTAASGRAEPALVGLVDGVGTGAMTWTSPDLAEQLAASAPGGLIGSSVPFPVLEDCATGPTAAVAFGGFPEATACAGTDGSATIVASFAGSAGGSAPIAYYGLWLDGARGSSTSAASATVTVHGTGRYDGTAVVAHATGCADEVPVVAWVGLDDGSPTGPIRLRVIDAAVPVGVGSTLVTVQRATDCARDLAAGARLRLRTDRGDLVGAAPTGSGLAITLDAVGDGAATLDALAEDTGGLATVRAWVPTHAASGSATTVFQGDDRRPVVWDQSPWGQATGSVDTVVIRFSEALLPIDVRSDRFTVTGPVATTVAGAVLTAPDTVTLTLSPAVDGSLGAYTVLASRNLRDLAGNKLDGARDGTASDHLGRFGALPPQAGPVTGCATTTPVFRPDGDDGAGEETDLAVLTFTSAAAPAAWRVSVRDGADALVWLDRVAAVGAADAWVWDGRASSGRIVDNGTYAVIVESMDGDGNVGGACTVSVTVDNAS